MPSLSANCLKTGFPHQRLSAVLCVFIPLALWSTRPSRLCPLRIFTVQLHEPFVLEPIIQQNIKRRFSVAISRIYIGTRVQQYLRASYIFLGITKPRQLVQRVFSTLINGIHP